MAVQPPDLEWRDGAPHSARFGDSYFSREGGLSESRAVFLAGCGLPDLWTSGALAARALFRVGELGFGTGLNALALWDLWRRTRAPGQRLVMASVEAFPLGVEDAVRAHAAFPEVADLSARLRAQWPAPSPGAHFLDFAEDGFSLIVLHDEAGAALAQMEGAFDAWFLDGFAPSRNPQMWRPELFARIAALSAPGARAATFTVAGLARRGLMEAGFAVEKRPGFGRKKERLEARLERPPAAAPQSDPLPRGEAAGGDVLILGGGVAGCAVAHALRARGRAVRIVGDRPPASLPPAALLTPRLENADRPHQRALFAAFLYAANLYARLGVFTVQGALRLPKDDAESARLESLAALWPGLETADGGLRIPVAGVLDPARALAALADDTPRLTARVARIERGEGAWRLLDESGAALAEAPALVLAGGAAAAAGLAPLPALGLSLSGGQVSLHDAAQPLATAVSWGGFVAPLRLQDGGHGVLVGATHDPVMDAAPPAPDPARAAALAAEANARLPAVKIDPRPRDIWTGVRAATADRLPCAGPLPDVDAYCAAWAAAAKSGRAAEDARRAFAPGLYALTGLGSRGFAHAPLLAQALAAEICGEPSPLEASARRALHPARFLWRSLKRG